MKVKAGLNSAALKEFFVKHGEKLGLFVAVVLTAYVVMSAYELQPYTKTPKQLQSDVDAARNNLNSSDRRLNLAEAGIVMPSKDEGFLDKVKRELLTKLNPADFNGMEWNRPLFETKQRRVEPAYLAVRDLRVEFRYASIDVRGGEGAKLGDEWITVTGLVPFEEQTAAYYTAFRNALDQTTYATPDYELFEIRRAIVKTLDPNEAVEWDKLTPIDLKTAWKDVQATWAGLGEEVAAKEATDPELTEPLPPLTNKDFGLWAVHPNLQAAPQDAVGDTEGAGLGGPVLGVPIAPQGLAQNPNPNSSEKPRPKNLLLRFLDFDIEPGKNYRYEVRLIMKNPNFQLDPAFLEKPELGEGPTRLAPWSQPSPPVNVPHLEWYFAGPAKSSGGDNEPEVTAGVKKWSPGAASVVMTKFAEIMRGAPLESAGAILLDFAWEKTENRLSGPGDRRVSRPVETLIINPRGELVINSQTMDQRLWDDALAVGVAGLSVIGGDPRVVSNGVGAAIPAPAAVPSVPPAVGPAPGVVAPVPTATPTGTAPKLQLKLN